MIPIGRLIKPHGTKGELVFLPYVSDLELLPDLTNRRVCLQHTVSGTQERTIIAWRLSPKRLFVQLEGCHDLSHAEALRDYEVLISRQHFPPLPEGEYYWFDIEGLMVYADDGRLLGTIVEIIHTGSNDVYVAQNGTQEVLIPALQDVVRAIDFAHGAMHLFPVQGLFD